MKKIFFSFIALALFFTSCNNEIDTLNENAENSVYQYDGYMVKDGYITFENGEAYDNLLNKLNSMSYQELKQWNANFPLNSLFKIYQTLEADIENEKATADFDTSYKFDDTKVHNEAISSLLNEKGFLVCENKILLYSGENAYVIPELDFELVESIRKGENTNLSEEIIVAKHSRELAINNENRDGKMRAQSWTSGEVKVNDKRKEWVYWEALLESTYHFSCNCWDTFAVVRIIGQASKKHLWWSKPFEDEIQMGELVMNACPPLIPIGTSAGPFYNVERMKVERMVDSGAKPGKIYFRPNNLNVKIKWSERGMNYDEWYSFGELSQ